ncbi:unnamed protein product [Ixodes persulcatus]
MRSCMNLNDPTGHLGGRFALFPAEYYYNNSHKYLCFYQATAERLEASGIVFELSLFPYHLCTHAVFCCATVNATTFRIEAPDEAHRFAFYLQTRNPYIKAVLGISGKVSASLLDNSWTFLEGSVAWLRSRRYEGLVLAWQQPLESLDARRKYGDLLERVGRRYFRENLSLSVVVDASGNSKTALDVGELDLMLPTNYSILVHPIVSDPPIVRSDKIEERDAVVYERQRLYRTLKALQSTVQRYRTGSGMYKMCYMLSFAGSSYKFWDRNTTGVEEVVFGPGDAGPSTRTPGSLAYYEICNEIWDSSKVFEYGVVSQREDSLVAHLSEFVVPVLAKYLHDVLEARCFGVWNLWFDDFAGSCDLGPYPLMRNLFGLFGD